MQEYWIVIASSLSYGRAHVAAHEEWVRSEDVLNVGLGVQGGTLSVHVANSDAL